MKEAKNKREDKAEAVDGLIWQAMGTMLQFCQGTVRDSVD